MGNDLARLSCGQGAGVEFAESTLVVFDGVGVVLEDGGDAVFAVGQRAQWWGEGEQCSVVAQCGWAGAVMGMTWTVM